MNEEDRFFNIGMTVLPYRGPWRRRGYGTVTRIEPSNYGEANIYVRFKPDACEDVCYPSELSNTNNHIRFIGEDYL